MEFFDHGSVGDVAALPHALGEFGNVGNPVIDGAASDLEKARQVLVDGAQHAELTGQLGILGPVEGGTSAAGHGRSSLVWEQR